MACLSASMLTGCAAAPTAPQPTNRPPVTSESERIERLSEATVTLQVMRESFWGDDTVTSEGGGSGFVIDTADGHVVVTAAHVIDGAVEVIAIDPDGRRAAVSEIIAFDAEADVAVLRVDGLAPDMRALKSAALPKLGARVVLISSPLGLSTTVAFGTVAAERKAHKAIQLSAGVSPGSSGGLVADRRGRAIAIIRSKASADVGGENITMATPIEHVHAALEQGEPQPLAARPDPNKMELQERHRVMTIRSSELAGYSGVARMKFVAGQNHVEHVCATASGNSFVALSETAVGAGWREGEKRACATVRGGEQVTLVIGTKKVGRAVELTVTRQP